MFNLCVELITLLNAFARVWARVRVWESEGEVTAIGLEPRNHLVLKRTLNHLAKLAK